jgi:predicted metal-dependent hydrolase
MSTDTSTHTSPTLIVRHLQVDLQTPLRRHWNGGDAFLTAVYNALSFSFPEGEQFFIDSVRQAAEHLSHDAYADAMRETLRNFIAQEASHRHLHAQYNSQLETQGLKNHWGPRIVKRKMRGRRILASSRLHHLHELAITAAYEHFTAVLGEITLKSIGTQSDWLKNADPTPQTLWRWHAAEECEHKAVAFDLYKHLGGGLGWRRFWMIYISVHFTTDLIRQTVNNLWHDHALNNPSTWWSALKFCFGRDGMIRRCAPLFAAYLTRDFHPNQLGNPALAEDWLAQHNHQWHRVGNLEHQDIKA